MYGLHPCKASSSMLCAKCLHSVTINESTHASASNTQDKTAHTHTRTLVKCTPLKQQPLHHDSLYTHTHTHAYTHTRQMHVCGTAPLHHDPPYTHTHSCQGHSSVMRAVMHWQPGSTRAPCGKARSAACARMRPCAHHKHEATCVSPHPFMCVCVCVSQQAA